MAIMLAWAVTALACGYLVLSRTDVTSISRPRRRRHRVPRVRQLARPKSTGVYHDHAGD
jgi:hypothetical protein